MRLLARCLLLALLGFATTVAVAWAIALRSSSVIWFPGDPQVEGLSIGPREPGGAPEHHLSLLRVRTAGTLKVQVLVTPDPALVFQDDGPESYDWKEFRFHFLKGQMPVEVAGPLATAALPWLNGKPWPAPGVSDGREAVARGWPFLAVWCEREGAKATGPGEGLVGGVPISAATPVLGRLAAAREVVLPYGPVWPGLIVDAGLFSAAWSIVFLAPGAVKRFARARRGLCAACGYDLNGIGVRCPECGRQVRDRCGKARHKAIQ